jgi:hypothetical protein
MSDEKLVDYGYGRVEPHPLPLRQRPDNPAYANPEIKKTQDARLKEHINEENIRDRANKLQGGTSHDKGNHTVWIRMPSGSKCFVGGEALVQALANGGQPMDEPKMKPTINGQVAGHPAPRVYFLE